MNENDILGPLEAGQPRQPALEEHTMVYHARQRLLWGDPGVRLQRGLLPSQRLGIRLPFIFEVAGGNPFNCPPVGIGDVVFDVLAPDPPHAAGANL